MYMDPMGIEERLSIAMFRKKQKRRLSVSFSASISSIELEKTSSVHHGSDQWTENGCILGHNVNWLVVNDG